MYNETKKKTMQSREPALDGNPERRTCFTGRKCDSLSGAELSQNWLLRRHLRVKGGTTAESEYQHADQIALEYTVCETCVHGYIDTPKTTRQEARRSDGDAQEEKDIWENERMASG